MLFILADPSPGIAKCLSQWTRDFKILVNKQETAAKSYFNVQKIARRTIGAKGAKNQLNCTAKDAKKKQKNENMLNVLNAQALDLRKIEFIMENRVQEEFYIEMKIGLFFLIKKSTF